MPAIAIENCAENIVEKEFMDSFRYTLLFQMLFGTCRIDLKDRFVTSPTKLQKLYSISLIMLALVLNCITIHSSFPIYFGYDQRIYPLKLVSAILKFIIFLLNIIHVRFFNLDANANFYIHLQNIDRTMKISKVKFINQSLLRINLFSILFLLIMIALLVGFTVALSEIDILPFVVTSYNIFSVLLEVMYCSNILMYFIIRIRFINAIIKNHLDPDNVIIFTITKPILTKNNMRCIAARAHDFSTSDLYTSLRQLFDGFTKFQDLYRFQVFLFCFKQIVVGVITFGFFVMTPAKRFGIVSVVLEICYPIMELLIVLFLSVRCELFFRDVIETKRLCIGIMALYQEGPLREKAREMFKMIDETPPRFSVYDMWNMDAYTFLKILSILTTSFITILQFALL